MIIKTICIANLKQWFLGDIGGCDNFENQFVKLFIEKLVIPKW